MASLVLTGDTSGQVTLAAPAVAGTTTLTLPATTGTVLNDATVGVCRAWVNFNGTGTVAIRASFNVTSITDGGVGTYTVNFTTAMPDVNYCVALQGSDTAGASAVKTQPYTRATGSVIVFSQNAAGITSIDLNEMYVAIFR